MLHRGEHGALGDRLQVLRQHRRGQGRSRCSCSSPRPCATTCSWSNRARGQATSKGGGALLRVRAAASRSITTTSSANDSHRGPPSRVDQGELAGGSTTCSPRHVGAAELISVGIIAENRPAVRPVLRQRGGTSPSGGQPGAGRSRLRRPRSRGLRGQPADPARGQRRPSTPAIRSRRQIRTAPPPTSGRSAPPVSRTPTATAWGIRSSSSSRWAAPDR